MNKAQKLLEALSKGDAKKQADQLKQFLSKLNLKRSSKEEEKAIEKWADSKDLSDEDLDRVLKQLK